MRGQGRKGSERTELDSGPLFLKPGNLMLIWKFSYSCDTILYLIYVQGTGGRSRYNFNFLNRYRMSNYIQRILQ